MSAELMAESKAKLAELARKDKERIELEAAKNKVESYVYKIKNKLADDEESIAKVSTEEQREELRKLASDGEEWMYDDADDADLDTLKAKYEELSEPAEKVWIRVKEMTSRPEAITELRKKLVKIEDILEKWATTVPQVTDEEKDEVRAKIEEIRKWITEQEEAQAAKEPHEDPAFLSEDVPSQTKSLQRVMTRLSKKPKPKPEKKENDDENKTDAEGSEEGEENLDEAADEADSSSEEEDATEAKGEEAESTGDEEETTGEEEAATGDEENTEEESEGDEF
jgi:hypoxia up-regulated 1